jgi:hypothetical protein
MKILPNLNLSINHEFKNEKKKYGREARKKPPSIFGLSSFTENQKNKKILCIIKPFFSETTLKW